MAMQLKPDPSDQGVITKAFLKKLCKADFKQYYSTPHLNDVLYLHYKGFSTIDNLDEYTGLKCLYLEGNAIKRIQGLDCLKNIRCLYLQENMIGKIQGLQGLTELVNLNLSQNLLEKVQGLATLTKLSNLQVKNNRIGSGGLDDVRGLLECPSISALDISCNKIQTQQFLPEILMKMDSISVIYMQNNGFNKKIPHYRKSIISKISQLKYIDDKPIFEDEKRFAMAWARGGLQQERAQRARYKQEQEQKQLRQHQQFKAMIQRYKEEGRRQRQKQKNEGSESQSESNSQSESLETYKSPHESSQRVSSSQSESENEASSQKAQSQKGEPVTVTEQPLHRSDPAYLQELD